MKYKKRGIVVFIVIVLILAGFFIQKSIPFRFPFSGNSINTASSTVINTQKKGVFVSEEVPQLVFITQKELQAGYPETGSVVGERETPQLSETNKGGNFHLFSEINKEVIGIMGENCLDFDNKENIEEVYQMALSNHGTEKNKVSDEEKIEVIKKANFYSQVSATTTLLTSFLWSIEITEDSSCGGVHPNFGVYGVNYLLSSSSLGHAYGSSVSVKTLTMSDIFSDFSHTKKEIYKKIKEAVIASVNESCEDSIATVLDYDIKNNEDTSDNTVSFSLNKEGVNILSFGLSQAEANCEPRGVLIPYGDFGKNVSPKFLELLHGV